MFTRDSNNFHVREVCLKKIKDILNTFRHHVHPHGITSAASESHVQILARNSTLNSLQPGKSAWPAHISITYYSIIITKPHIACSNSRRQKAMTSAINIKKWNIKITVTNSSQNYQFTAGIQPKKITHQQNHP